MEIWKVVDKFPAYEISSWGRVRRVISAKGATVGMVLKYRLNSHGRVQYRLQQNGKYSEQQAHRLVLEAFVGPCPNGYECRHLDGNPLNNDVENLAWGTRSENMLDKRRHGTSKNGGPPQKFSDEEVLEIKKDKSSGMTYRQLIVKYDCSMQAVADALLRR